MKKILLLLISFFAFYSGWSQTFSENMGTPSTTTAIGSHTFQNSPAFTYSGTGDVRTSSPSPGGGGNVMFNNFDEDFIISGFGTSMCSSLDFSFSFLKSRNADDGSSLILQYSTDGPSGPWTNIGSPSVATGSGTTGWSTNNTLSLSNVNGIKAFRFVLVSTPLVNTSNLIRIDDFTINGSGVGCLLPVEFSSIQATAKSKSVNVTWETASEINNEMFVIERASDARNFEAIGKVAGQGNSTTVQSYSFEDLAPVAGTNYYRIKQVDFDGAYEYSEVVAVEMDKVSNIRVVPTATYNWADIYATGSKSVAVYSMSGELMTSITSEEGAYQIDLNDWAQGVYLVQINYGSYTETAKLIRL